MCGLTGFLDLSRRMNHEALAATVDGMAGTLLHRGPDDGGSWVDAQSGIALGFRRLAIVDLSPEGHQPMQSESGRYVVVFNGEIYNFQDIRRELEPLGHLFRGHSDTEVMLAAFDQWGMEASIPRLNGMFAIALWDREERVLHLARDRFGKKPLYYGWMGSTFLFGSELKALRAHPAFRAEIDRGALALYLRHNYIPGPYSIYRGVHKLPPASRISLPSAEAGVLPEPVAYWSAMDAAREGLRRPLNSQAEAADQLDALLRDAVKIRMVADVPLGAFLSGGVDSSVIVALMQSISSRPVRTFSIGFHEERFNEAGYAKAVAQRLGTDHTELYVTPEEAMEVVPLLPSMFDEPFGDSSQIPTYLVSKMARRDVTVSLSGDGGDELFAGYEAYFDGLAAMRKLGRIPRFLRAPLSAVLSSRREMLTAETPELLYRSLISQWKDPLSAVLGAEEEPPTAFTRNRRVFPDFLPLMMYLDTVAYLPDDILVKVDRASMAVSLEARAPLLDYRVYELAWRIPVAMKTSGRKGKLPLRAVLSRYVPDRLIERPKRGFAVPVDEWLRGPLRNWAEELLAADRLRREGYFDPAPVRRKWEEHLTGRQSWHRQLWPVLMFQSWLEESARARTVPSELAAARD